MATLVKCTRCDGSGCGSKDTPPEAAAWGDVYPCAACDGTGKIDIIGKVYLFEGNPYKVICFGNSPDTVDIYPNTLPSKGDIWRNVPINILIS